MVADAALVVTHDPVDRAHQAVDLHGQAALLGDLPAHRGLEPLAHVDQAAR